MCCWYKGVCEIQAGAVIYLNDTNKRDKFICNPNLPGLSLRNKAEGKAQKGNVNRPSYNSFKFLCWRVISGR